MIHLIWLHLEKTERLESKGSTILDLIHYYTAFNDTVQDGFENTVGKGENAVNSIYSFSQNVSSPIKDIHSHFSCIS